MKGYTAVLRWQPPPHAMTGFPPVCSTAEALWQLDVKEWEGKDPRKHRGDSDCG